MEQDKPKSKQEKHLTKQERKKQASSERWVAYREEKGARARLIEHPKEEAAFISKNPRETYNEDEAFPPESQIQKEPTPSNCEKIFIPEDFSKIMVKQYCNM